MVEINLNTQIIADLTEHGEKILRRHYEKLAKKNQKIDIESAIGSHYQFANKYSFTMWEFAFIFGDSMYAGGENIVENNDIAIEEKHLKNVDFDLSDYQIKISTKRQEMIFTIASIEIDATPESNEYIEILQTDDQTGRVNVTTTKNMLKTFI